MLKLFSPFRVSPLGVLPKKTPGEFRLIHHLSYPRGSSVNDSISPDHTSVSYATISNAIQHIKAEGRWCFLVKTDIKNAFRIFPIRPQDYGLLGMRWRDLIYYGRCMSMGCSNSCKTFETLSTALEWIARGNSILLVSFIYLMISLLLLSLTHYVRINCVPSLTFVPFLAFPQHHKKRVVQLTHCHLLVLNWILFLLRLVCL